MPDLIPYLIRTQTADSQVPSTAVLVTHQFDFQWYLTVYLLIFKGELNPKIKLDLNDSFFTLINKYNPHIF